MGKIDTITKEYIENPVIFADAFNQFLNHGEQRIDPTQLTELDTTGIVVPYGADNAGVPEQKYRDVLQDTQYLHCIPKCKGKKAYLAAHRDEITIHEAAKQAFDKLGGKQIPKVAEIQAEFSSLLAEKKELYQEYRQARKDMVDLGTVRQSIERILNIQQTNEKSQDAQR